MELRQPVPELCLGCHDKIKKTLATATVPHAMGTKDRSCLTCHAAHSSNVGKLLAGPPAVTCLECHNKPVQTAQGKTIACVPDIADTQLFKHGEIRDGQCSGCHQVHGGQRAFLLVKPDAQGLYQKFTPDAYALCFSCHDVQLALAATTDKATGFRNGNQNLHVIHLAGWGRERSCETCHATHTSHNPELIRSTLAYGKWTVPIGFVPTSTGGSCAASCHASRAYDRNHAVATTGPVAGPAAPVLRGP